MVAIRFGMIGPLSVLLAGLAAVLWASVWTSPHEARRSDRDPHWLLLGGEVYRNEELGYTFQVPDQMALREVPIDPEQQESYYEIIALQSSRSVSSPRFPLIRVSHFGGSYSFYKPPEETDVFEWLCQGYGSRVDVSCDPAVSDLSIGSMTTAHVRQREPEGLFNVYYFIRSTQLYKISMLDTTFPNADRVYDAFLRSFRFGSGSRVN